jgi:hypothetical protein
VSMTSSYVVHIHYMWTEPVSRQAFIADEAEAH